MPPDTHTPKAVPVAHPKLIDKYVFERWYFINFIFESRVVEIHTPLEDDATPEFADRVA